MRPLRDLETTDCRWPMAELAEGEGWRLPMCGRRVAHDGSPYCADHLLVAMPRSGSKITPAARRSRRLSIIRSAVARLRLRLESGMADDLHPIDRTVSVPGAAQPTSAGAPPVNHGGLKVGEDEGQPLAPAPVEDQHVQKMHTLELTPDHVAEAGNMIATDHQLPENPANESRGQIGGVLPANAGEIGDRGAFSDENESHPLSSTLRPIEPICAEGIDQWPAPTGLPLIEWMAPSDLLIESAYQRDLSPKSIALIRRIVAVWDWRRFKPPVVAWTERGFEIIDGQHTAIAAATRQIEKIPVLVVEAADVRTRAQAFIGHNRDRLVVSPVQIHHAAVAAGDQDAQTVEQVCERAGLKIVRSAHGGYRWQPGDTVAVAGISALIGRRGAMRARELLQGLVSAGLAPVTVHDMKAAEHLFFHADFAEELEPLPEGAADLAAAIRTLGANSQKEAKEYAAMKCLPLWKAQAAVWFRKTRKRRRAT